MRRHLSCLPSWWSHVEIGHYVREPLVSGSPLFAVWVYSSWRNAWFNSGHMLCVSSWCFWKVFFVKVNSFLEVDSRPALLGPRSLEKCALLQVAWAATL